MILWPHTSFSHPPLAQHLGDATASWLRSLCLYWHAELSSLTTVLFNVTVRRHASWTRRNISETVQDWDKKICSARHITHGPRNPHTLILLKINGTIMWEGRTTDHRQTDGRTRDAHKTVIAPPLLTAAMNEWNGLEYTEVLRDKASASHISCIIHGVSKNWTATINMT